MRDRGQRAGNGRNTTWERERKMGESKRRKWDRGKERVRDRVSEREKGNGETRKLNNITSAV